MNDALTPPDGELLSAYLTGELDARATADLEARLAREPELASRLEATRTVVEGLARLDDVEPPPGFSDRLHARLAAERATAVPTAAAADERPAAAPASAEAGAPAAGAVPDELARARTRRASWLQQRWPALGAAAAAVVGVALLATVALTEFGPGMDVQVTGDDAAPEAADEDLGAEILEVPAAEDRAEPAPEQAPLSAPLIVESGAAVDDAAGARDHLGDSPAQELVGLPVDEAEDLAAAFSVAVRQAEPLGTAGDPGACLEAITAGAEQPVVPAHVEAVTYEGRDALAYVTVTAREDSTALDRVEGWIVEPAGCATRLYVELRSDG
jgi:hypothetical protein